MTMFHTMTIEHVLAYLNSDNCLNAYASVDLGDEPHMLEIGKARAISFIESLGFENHDTIDAGVVYGGTALLIGRAS